MLRANHNSNDGSDPFSSPSSLTPHDGLYSPPPPSTPNNSLGWDKLQYSAAAEALVKDIVQMVTDRQTREEKALVGMGQTMDRYRTRAYNELKLRIRLMSPNGPTSQERSSFVPVSNTLVPRQAHQSQFMGYVDNIYTAPPVQPASNNAALGNPMPVTILAVPDYFGRTTGRANPLNNLNGSMPPTQPPARNYGDVVFAPPVEQYQPQNMFRTVLDHNTVPMNPTATSIDTSGQYSQRLVPGRLLVENGHDAPYPSSPSLGDIKDEENTY